MKARRYEWGSATPRQRAYLGNLAREVAPNVSLTETLRRHGAPDDGRSLTKAHASLIIDSLKRTLGDRESVDGSMVLRDPGEDSADRWAEGQVGL